MREYVLERVQSAAEHSSFTTVDNDLVSNVTFGNEDIAAYFEGLPIPSSLALVGLLSYWTKQGWIAGKQGLPLGTITLWGPPGGDGELHVFSIVFGLWAAAMVSKTLRVPKP